MVLNPPNKQVGGFGYKVGVSSSSAGTYAIVSATDVGSTPGRNAYVYTRVGSTWRLQATLPDPDKGVLNNFGQSVAIYGTTAVVGEDYAKNGSGLVFVYVKSGTTWRLQATLINPTRADNFGSDVSISGSTIIVGDGEQPSPSARPTSSAATTSVFTRSGSKWRLQAKAHFTPSAPKITDADAMLDWTMSVPARGHASYGFQVHILPGATSQAELAQWAAAVTGPVSGAVSLRSLAIQPGSPHLTVGHTMRLTLSGVLADGKPAPAADLATVTWRSSDSQVLTVAADGTITALGPGTARVTAQSGTVAASVTVTVAAGATVTPTAPTPTTGYTYQPAPTQGSGTPATAQPTTSAPTHSHPASPTSAPTVTPSTL